MPHNFRRLSAIDQAELGMEQAIAKGEWAGLLPSYKTLAQILGFSVPTIAHAAGRLSERGILKAAGARRRFRIVAGKARRKREISRASKPGEAGRLLILSPSEEAAWDDNQRRVVLEIMGSAIQDGWACDKETDPFLRARETLRRWDKLLLRHRPTHLLAIQGTRALGAWARSNGLKVAFIGGEILRHGEGLSLGVHLGPLLRHACQELAKRGHRRLMLPYWGELTALAESAAGILGEELGLDPARLLADGSVFAAPPGQPKAHRERLLRHMERTRPTALILVDWRDFLVSWNCIRELGLRAPEDLSVIVLNPGAETDWFSPVPAHYRIPQGHFADEIRRWRMGKAPVGDAMTRAALAAWNPGETLGPAPKAA